MLMGGLIKGGCCILVYLKCGPIGEDAFGGRVLIREGLLYMKTDTTYREFCICYNMKN